MLDAKTYINANKVVCAKNCIRSRLWSGKPFSKSLDELADYAGMLTICPSEALTTAVKDVLRSMTTTDGVNAVIHGDLWRYPSVHTVQDCIKEDFQTPGMTAQKIASLVAAELTLMRE